MQSVDSQQIAVWTKLETWAEIFTAIGTVAVSILAIWGDWFRSRLAGPRLELSLRSMTGDMTLSSYGKRMLYYHLLVQNKRSWSPAKSVRVLVTQLSKRGPDGEYHWEEIIGSLQLQWAYPQYHELLPTITSEETCDLGSLQESGLFRLATYISPNNFQGFVGPNESMRVTVIAIAHNAQSQPLELQVSWNGTWSTNSDEMRKHCVVKEITRAAPE